MRRNRRARLFLEHLAGVRASLEAYARRFVRRSSEAEDALQTALLAAYRDFDSFTEGTNFRAWIFRYVTGEVLNRSRKTEPITGGTFPGDLPVEESWDLVASAELFDCLLDEPERVFDVFEDPIAEALERLAPLERATLLLSAIGEFSYREIHQMLGIPLTSVMGYLSRARQRMRIWLARYAHERGLYRGQRGASGRVDE